MFTAVLSLSSSLLPQNTDCSSYTVQHTSHHCHHANEATEHRHQSGNPEFQGTYNILQRKTEEALNPEAILLCLQSVPYAPWFCHCWSREEKRWPDPQHLVDREIPPCPPAVLDTWNRRVSTFTFMEQIMEHQPNMMPVVAVENSCLSLFEVFLVYITYRKQIKINMLCYLSYHIEVNMHHVSAQGVDEHLTDVHY